MLSLHLLPRSVVFLEFDVSDVEPYKVEGLPLDGICVDFFITHSSHTEGGKH